MADNLLRTLLHDQIKQREISYREAARQIGVGHSTVIRIVGGEAADIDTLISVCKWLGVNPSDVLDAAVQDENSMVNEINMLLDAYPELRELFREAMDRLRAGKIDPATMADLIGYTNYRLRMMETTTDGDPKQERT